jgi:hypothetical protein
VSLYVFQLVRLNFDEKGLLASYTDLSSSVTQALAQNFFYYPGVGEPTKGQKSGAYIFRPRSQAVPVSHVAKLEMITVGDDLNCLKGSSRVR